MADDFEFKLNRKGVGELLKSNEMERVLESYGQSVAGRAGEGYRTGAYQGTDRVKVNVWPGTREAWQDNMENNTLLKAVGRHD